MVEFKRYIRPLIYETLEMEITNMDPVLLSKMIDQKLKANIGQRDRIAAKENSLAFSKILNLNIHEIMRPALTTLSIAYEWPKQGVAHFLGKCEPWNLCYEPGGIKTGDGSSLL
ncbi:hypothetical protein OCU04_010527 [Sclerotinia nivalis]|uniref:Uncharacterized protein n=1 Tax=Sclerotinia nivalis TaxID=352851 RepID=A0A9X0DE44_9HELO|nr:hypothetical protein OCU04_010527 [Sclerotinia nivalis]